jgi:hypothetical protein
VSCATHHASSPAWTAMLALSAACTAYVYTGDVGAVFIQGSAYGSERRAALRPPVWMYGLLPVLYAIVTSMAAGGVLLVACRRWWAAPIAAIGGLATFQFGRACHALARRWLVIVPAGFVVHDPYALADTAMMPRLMVRSIAPALVGTDALDLTAGASGLALQVDLAEPQPFVLAGRPGHPGGRPQVAQSILIRPTRPGRFLAMARAARLPVRTG